MTEQLLTVSYGGGVQSTALLVLAAQGYIPHRTFLFANTGDDSELPATLRYVREVAFDYAAANGIELHELHREPKRGHFKGEVETLWGRLMRDGSRSLPIPIRMSNGAPGTRSCTTDFKIRVVGRWLREHGATADNPARVAIGISTDEYQRASSRKVEDYEIVEYPLLTLEHRLASHGANRNDCKRIIADAGLPIPPKSSCFFCPFHKPSVFADQARTDPELFAKSVLLEDTLNARRDKLVCPFSGRPARRITSGNLACVTHGPDCDFFNLDGNDDDLPCVEAPVESEPVAPGGVVHCCSTDLIVAADGTIPAHSKDHVYLTRFGRPLREVFANTQMALLDDWDEDEGYRCGDRCDT